MAKIKYMGSADIRSISKGDDFGGRLGDPLSADVVWDKSNHWVVDTKAANLSDEAVELLLEDDGFKDVSDMKRVPTNDHQATFLGMKSVSDEEADLVTTTASATDSPSGATATTVGGSTDGGSTKGKKST